MMLEMSLAVRQSCAVTGLVQSLWTHWTGSCMKYMCLWTGEEPVETKGQCSTSGMCKVPWQQDKTVESLAEVNRIAVLVFTSHHGEQHRIKPKT